MWKGGSLYIFYKWMLQSVNRTVARCSACGKMLIIILIITVLYGLVLLLCLLTVNTLCKATVCRVRGGQWHVWHQSYVVLQWNHHRHPQDLILKKVTEDPGEYLHFQQFPSAWKSKSFIVSACVFGFPSPSVSVVNRLLKAPSGVLPALGFSPGTVCSHVCVCKCVWRKGLVHGD